MSDESGQRQNIQVVQVEKQRIDCVQKSGTISLISIPICTDMSMVDVHNHSFELPVHRRRFIHSSCGIHGTSMVDDE